MYQDVIQVSQHTFIPLVPKEAVNHPLEGGRGVAEPERHDRELIQSACTPKCRVRNALRVHLNLPVASTQIKSYEEARLSYLSDEVGDTRQWVLIRNGNVINIPIVYTNPPASSLLLHQYYLTRMGRV